MTKRRAHRTLAAIAATGLAAACAAAAALAADAATITGGLPPQDGFSSNAGPTVTFSTSDAAATGFECSLDGAEPSACSGAPPDGSLTLPVLTDGRHTFSVRAVGGADQTADTRAWTVDTSAPVVGFLSGPAGTVNSTTATFGFVANELVSFECSLDGAAYQACGAVVYGNTVTYNNLRDGAHVLKVRATDQAGNPSKNVAQREWTVSNPPTASFAVGPDAPLTDTTVVFIDTSKAPAGRSIVSRTWDLDNDGAYDDASGPSANRRFTRPGTYVVGLRVVDSSGGVDMTHRTVTVGNRPPMAKFLVFPESPAAGDPVYLVSVSADPDGPLASQQWDISGSGTIDDATTPSTRAFFDNPGRQTITLTVTDADGATSRVTRTIVIGKARPKLLSPFPVVRIAGTLSGRNTRIRTLSVVAPGGSRVEVRCRGRGCPGRRVVRPRRAGATAMRAFQRTFRPDTVLEVRVTQPGRIGKYVRFRIRSRRAPARTDACLLPGSSRPTRCPS